MKLIKEIIKKCNRRQRYYENKQGVSWYADCTIESYCDNCRKKIREVKKHGK